MNALLKLELDKFITTEYLDRLLLDLDNDRDLDRRRLPGGETESRGDTDLMGVQTTKELYTDNSYLEPKCT